MQAIQRGVLDTVRFGEPDDIERRDAGVAQHLIEVCAGVGDSFESRVGGGVLALLDPRIRTEARQRGMELGLRATGDAVGRPGIDEVRRGREMVAGVYVPVLSGDDQAVILPMRRRIGSPALGNRTAVGDGQSPTFA